MTWALCFERIDVFWQNMGMRAICFVRNLLFLTKYGHESSDFFVKNREKKTSYWLCWLINNVVLTEVTFFDQNSARQKGIFSALHNLFFFVFFQNSRFYITLKAIMTQKRPKFLPLCFRKKGFIFLEKMSSSFFYSFRGRKKNCRSKSKILSK